MNVLCMKVNLYKFIFESKSNSMLMLIKGYDN